MEQLKTSRLLLPTGASVEVVVVRLDDGRIIARTADELERINPAGAGGAPTS